MWHYELQTYGISICLEKIVLFNHQLHHETNTTNRNNTPISTHEEHEHYNKPTYFKLPPYKRWSFRFSARSYYGSTTINTRNTPSSRTNTRWQAFPTTTRTIPAHHSCSSSPPRVLEFSLCQLRSLTWNEKKRSSKSVSSNLFTSQHPHTGWCSACWCGCSCFVCAPMPSRNIRRFIRVWRLVIRPPNIMYALRDRFLTSSLLTFIITSEFTIIPLWAPGLCSSWNYGTEFWEVGLWTPHAYAVRCENFSHLGGNFVRSGNTHNLLYSSQIIPLWAPVLCSSWPR